jgi:hypothetical protein
VKAHPERPTPRQLEAEIQARALKVLREGNANQQLQAAWALQRLAERKSQEKERRAARPKPHKPMTVEEKEQRINQIMGISDEVQMQRDQRERNLYLKGLQWEAEHPEYAGVVDGDHQNIYATGASQESKDQTGIEP